MVTLIKWIARLLPVILLSVFFVHYQHQGSQIDKTIRSPTELVWGQGEQRLTVHKKRTGIKDEISTDIISVTRVDGSEMLSIPIRIDHDLFNTGFVEAMQ